LSETGTWKFPSNCSLDDAPALLGVLVLSIWQMQ